MGVPTEHDAPALGTGAGQSGATDRRLVLGAWATAMAAVGCSVAALVVHAANAARSDDIGELYLADVWISVAAPPVGAYLLTRTRARLLGAMLLATALLSLGGLAATYATHRTLTTDGDGVLTAAGSWLATWTWTPYLLLLTVVPLRLPDGRALSPRFHRASQVALGAVALIAVLSSVAPGPLDPFPLLTNPLGIEAAPWLSSVGRGLIATTVGVFVPLGVVSVVLRWRRSVDRSERRHLAWFAAALGALAVSVIVAEDLPYPWYDLAPALGFTLVLGAIVASATTSQDADVARRKREQLVVAREDERFRLHRDLHDGLGPELAGLALHLHAIGKGVTDEPARRQLSAAEQTLRRTVEEVRRIVDDLRPPALDQLGLVRAVDERAAAMRDASGISYVVQVDELPPALPPAVEVAAYRIACEAMTNVARHAGARRCRIHLTSDGSNLQIDVEDDGRGMREGDRTGVGLRSMRGRAEELGGRLVRGPGLDGAGLRVSALLPLVGV